jgi:hypothetical protein
MAKKGLTDWERKKIWLLSTGALNAMKSCHISTSYRSLLKHYNKDFPSPNY